MCLIKVLFNLLEIMNLIENSKSNYTNILHLGEELLNEGFELQITLGGYSMSPYLRNGETVIIKKESFNSLKIGDIIVFRSINKMIAHRIIAIRNINQHKTLITKGDSLIYFDKTITEERYIGKIKEFYRKNKSIKIDTPWCSVFNKLMSFISVISIPFLIILIPITLSSHFIKTHLLFFTK